MNKIADSKKVEGLSGENMKGKKEKNVKKKDDVSVASLLGSPSMWISLLVVSLVAAFFVYSTPLTTETPEPRPYMVEYDFGYDAELPPNPVYQTDRLVYGQPIFLSIVDKIDVDVKYRVQNPNAQIDNGELVLRSILIGSAGWTRELGAPVRVPFSGLEASAVVPVDFGEALAAAAENDAVTQTTSSLNVRVVAETYVQGRLLQNGKGPGDLIENTLADIVFSLRPNFASVMLPKDLTSSGTTSATGQMPSGGVVPGTAGASSETGYSSTETGYSSTETGYLSVESGYLSIDSGYTSTESGYLSEETGYLSSEPGLASSTPGAASSEPGAASSTPGAASSSSTETNGATPRNNPSKRDPSVKTITQMVPTEVKSPNTIGVLGFFEVPVDTARTVTVGLSAAFLLLTIYNLLVLRSAKKKGPIAMLMVRHSKRIVPMSKISISQVKDVVEIDTFEALYSISNETEQLIMMKRYDRETADFYVADNGSNYRFHMEPEVPEEDNKKDNKEDDSEVGESEVAERVENVSDSDSGSEKVEVEGGDVNDSSEEHDGPTSEV